MPKTKPLMATDSGVVLSPRSEGSDLEEPSFEFEKPQETLDVSQLCNMDQWDIDTTKEWLERQGFIEIAYVLCEKHKIDGKVLLSMTEEDLLLPLLDLRVFGNIRRLSLLLNNVRCEDGGSSSPRMTRRHQPYVRGQRRKPGLPCDSPGISPLLHHEMEQQPTRAHPVAEDSSKAGEESSKLDSTAQQSDGKGRESSASRLFSGSDFPAEYDVSKRMNKSKDLKVDYRKMLAAMVYAQAVLWLTSYTMVVVHDRVPDVEKYPPLPDLVLDNVPYIPWAFQAVETIGISMMSCLIITLVFHKHRTIIWRRCCALTGTVFLLRCVTMLITSLSVPGAHLKCDPSQYPETWMRLHRAFVIWSGFGMTLQGVRTCGDYMFSGHTTVITMLNMFITEYTPSRWYPLHTATWVANLFGIFFILAAHEHYSIDVFVAFYISSRLFLYYHSLANTSPIQKDRRTRIWFPLFSYFEENVDGDIPNEYEWPFSLTHVKEVIRSLIAKGQKESQDKAASSNVQKKVN